MKGKTISPEKANVLSKHLDRLDLLSLRQLNKEKIPFISTLASLEIKFIERQVSLKKLICL